MVATISAATVAASLVACGGDDGSTNAVQAGELLSATPLTGAPVLPSAGRSELITYISDNAKGEPVVVSGTVQVPKGQAPDGGWPVISWAHGTTGVADACAPSADFVGGPAHDYLGGVSTELNRYIDAGYAVVQTDYQGMGTPGGHPYMDGITESNAVTDIVRAGRRLDGSLGKTWYAMGHSQGGHAALWAATKGAERAPELDLKGAVAVAPGGDTWQTPEYFRSGSPAVAPMMAFLPLLLLGAQAGDPSIDAESYVTPESNALLDVGRTQCIAQIRAMAGTVPVDKAFSPNADVTKLVDYLKKQNDSTLKPTVPVLVVNGTADVVVPEPGTKKLADQLCKNGGSVAFKTYPGVDHRGAVGASVDDATTFAKDAAAGKAFPGTC